MVNQKSLNEIVQNIINNIHDVLPDVDTKEGTFTRDVIIDPISDEFASIYADMKLIELTQSILTAKGKDLDRLAANYFIYRKNATNSFGKLRFYINEANFTQELYIPKGTIVSTLGSITKQSVQVQTTESIYVNKQNYLNLPINEQGYKFLEVPATSIESGISTNLNAGELVQQINNISSVIAYVNNPFSFTGGTDNEDDTSLALRINLAMSGANIGTKNGYLSYILKQNGVIDAKVIGAGDFIMLRDGGYVDSTGKYVLGKGGMVDIYIRGGLSEEEETTFVATNDYINGSNPFEDIILPKQPITNIVSMTSKSGKLFINASDYEIEKGTYIDELGNVRENIKYYKDIVWDFSIKDDFPDKDYLPLSSGLTQSQIAILKQQVDAALKEALIYMTNINYGLNYSLMTPEANPGTNLFVKHFYNNQVYKIVANVLSTDGNNLNGRTFIKKDDKIYIRIYKQPDYILVKDNTPTGNSIQAKDKIKWLNGIKPSIDDVLTIKYDYNQLIIDLQSGIEDKRVLTADVLIKEAEKLPVEIIIEAYCFPQYDPTTVKSNIINRVTKYIDSIKNMGGDFDRSDIIAVARDTDGVDEIDIEKLQISTLGSGAKRKIVAKDNQYLKVENIVVTVYSNEIIK